MPRTFSEECNAARSELQRAREEKEQKHREAEEARKKSASTNSLVDFNRWMRANSASLRADEAYEAACAKVLEDCADEVVIRDLSRGSSPPSPGTKLKIEPKFDDGLVDDVIDVLRDKIPDADKVGLDWIILEQDEGPEVEKVEAKTGKKRRFRVGGDYSADAKRIQDYYPSEVDTIKHEVGHHVWHNHLNDDQRKAWKDFWDANHAKMPTDYAKLNHREGFAEVYEFFRNERPLDDAVAEFISEMIRPNPAPAGGQDEAENE
jgi:hypothetical protein